MVTASNGSGSLRFVNPRGTIPTVKRTIWLLLLLAVIAAVTLVTVRLRASRAGSSQLGGTGELPGSLDTWPDVPRKQVA
jgi:hypothetical protein